MVGRSLTAPSDWKWDGLQPSRGAEGLGGHHSLSRPICAVQRARLCAITWSASQTALSVSRSFASSADSAMVSVPPSDTVNSVEGTTLMERRPVRSRTGVLYSQMRRR